MRAAGGSFGMCSGFMDVNLIYEKFIDKIVDKHCISVTIKVKQ